jgi:hypothetical protein
MLEDKVICWENVTVLLVLPWKREDELNVLEEWQLILFRFGQSDHKLFCPLVPLCEEPGASILGLMVLIIDHLIVQPLRVDVLVECDFVAIWLLIHQI